MPPKLLIITRNYPPQIGGLENYSFNLVAELKRHMSVKVIALGQTKPHLIWFMPAALMMGADCCARPADSPGAPL